MGNSILVELDDPRTDKIAEAISNKTAKKILGLLSEKEMSESELAKILGIGLNTVEYNIKKLVEAGLIEKVGGFLWSIKGKRIYRYRVVNKRIVILPKKSIRGVLPAVLISGIVSLGIKLWSDNFIFRKGDFAVGERVSEKMASEIAAGASSSAQIVERTGIGISEGISQSVLRIAESAWLWFLAGALFGLLVYLVWNIIRRKN